MTPYQVLCKTDEKFRADNLPMNPETDNFHEEYGEYYWFDYELYHSQKFAEAMAEAEAEMAYLAEHPEERRVYTSTKEMFRDMGLDVSNIPDR